VRLALAACPCAHPGGRRVGAAVQAVGALQALGYAVEQGRMPANPVDCKVVIRGSPGRSSTKAPVMVVALPGPGRGRGIRTRLEYELASGHRLSLCLWVSAAKVIVGKG